MSETRQVIEAMRALGPEGSYSLDVAHHEYPGVPLDAVEDFPRLLAGIHTDSATGTLVPIDSSMMEVPIRETIPEFRRRDLVAEHEIWLDVVSTIVGSAASIDEITDLHSKDVALSQNSAFKPELGRHKHESTAAAAEYVARLGDPTQAAIGSISLAEKFGLNVLARATQNPGLNRTVMVVTRGRNGYVPDLDAISEQATQHGLMLIRTTDSTKPNALARAMTEIGEREINVDDIVRLREPGTNQMEFFIRLAGAGANIADLLKSKRAAKFMDMHVIGVYDLPVILNSDEIVQG